MNATLIVVFDTVAPTFAVLPSVDPLNRLPPPGQGVLLQLNFVGV
jgi:hypothetical protein